MAAGATASSAAARWRLAGVGWRWRGDGDVVVAVVLGNQAHARPLVHVVVRVEGDELLRVRLVQSVNLDGAAQGVAQQEHLHLPEGGERGYRK